YNKYVIDPNTNPSSISLTCTGRTEYRYDYLYVYRASCDSGHNTSSASRLTSDSGTIDISTTISSLSASQCVYVVFDSDSSSYSGYNFSCSYTSYGGSSSSTTNTYTSLSGSFGPSSYYNNQYEKYIVHPDDLASASVSCTGSSESSDYIKLYKAYCSSSHSTSNSSFITSDSGTINISSTLDFSSSSYNCFYVVWDTNYTYTRSSNYPTCTYTATDTSGNTGDDDDGIDPMLYII
ncbi:hypothetical protein KIPB_012981, partial [Kipferlia bialata]